MQLLDCIPLTVAIACDYETVCRFLADPRNFSHWAAGMGDSLELVKGEWTARSPAGPVRIRFSPSNAFGVADHHVILQNGSEIYVPLRAIRNADGAEVTLTLLRLPDMNDEQFQADQAAVSHDLQTLKSFLESHAGR